MQTETNMPPDTSKKRRPMSKREAVKLISQRLENPEIDNRTFIDLTKLMKELAPWKRRPRRKLSQSEELELLVQTEEKKQKRSGLKPF
jgi:hypothetical protein